MAYQEFLRANGINPEDLSQKEYSDIISTQEMYNDDLVHFSNSENCKEVSRAGARVRAGRGRTAAGTAPPSPHLHRRLRCCLPDLPLLPAWGGSTCV